jgi:signal transduction histidine kinase
MSWDLRSDAGTAWHDIDSDQMRRALRNLLINALEASNGPAVIRVAVSLRSTGLRIGIRDWGCGMDRQTQENLFTPLFTTKARGTGLGLCYSRRVVERHGGSLSVISRPGKGTHVTVDLPPADLRAEAA